MNGNEEQAANNANVDANPNPDPNPDPNPNLDNIPRSLDPIDPTLQNSRLMT